MIDRKNQSPEEMAKEMTEVFNSNVVAFFVAMLVRSQVPMYQGELNPTWVFWNNVASLCIPPSDTESKMETAIKP